MRGLLDHVGRMQQRLGRDAADVEADPAEAGVTLDQHGIEAEIGAAERRGVAAGTGADHHHRAFDIGLLTRGGSRLRRGAFTPSPSGRGLG